MIDREQSDVKIERAIAAMTNALYDKRHEFQLSNSEMLSSVTTLVMRFGKVLIAEAPPAQQGCVRDVIETCVIKLWEQFKSEEKPS